MSEGPARVELAMGAELRLAAITDALVSELRARGLTVKRHLFGDASVVLDEHTELARAFQILAGAGVLFLRDHRQGWSPADLAGELFATGKLVGKAQACAFDGSEWLVWDLPEQGD